VSDHRQLSRPPPPFRRRWRWRWSSTAALLVLVLVPLHAAIPMLAVALAARLLLAAARGRGSRLAAPHGLRAIGDGQWQGGLLLGHEPCGRPVLLGDSELSAHGLILGASGSGKSTTLLTILAEHVQRGTAVIALDLKGSPSFAQELRDAAAAAGRPLRVWSPDGPEQWNPLANGNPTQLKDKLIATERFTEPHFQRAAERYLQLALQVLVQTGTQPNLADVVRVMDPRRLGALTRGLSIERAQYVREYLAGLSSDQLSAIRGLASRLAIITESHTGAYVLDQGGDGIDCRRALAGEEVIVFSLNSSAYGKLAAQLGALALQDLQAAVGDRLAEYAPAGAIVAIDEFSALGSDNVISLLARGREARVSVLLATQELADLDRAARGLRDQVLGNTALKIAHRQEVPESANVVARMAGTVSEWEPTYTLRRNPFGLRVAHGETVRLVQRPIVDPDVVRTLATGEAVLITKLPAAATRRVRVRPSSARPPTTRGGRAATGTAVRTGSERA
jgi:type IV secretory pathway TraG/TraD family ATPase VirD4